MATQAPKTGSEAQFLQESGTFQGLTERDLKKVVRAAERTSLPAHWGLIHERTPGDACYILLSGRVAVYNGRDVVAELGPGEVVGEVALRQGRLRSATVSTLEPVEMLRISGDNLDKLVREIPALRTAIEAAAARHGGSPDGS